MSVIFYWTQQEETYTSTFSRRSFKELVAIFDLPQTENKSKGQTILKYSTFYKPEVLSLKIAIASEEVNKISHALLSERTWVQLFGRQCLASKVENAQILWLSNSISMCITKRLSHRCQLGYLHKFMLSFTVHSNKKIQTARLILSHQKKVGKER